MQPVFLRREGCSIVFSFNVLELLKASVWWIWKVIIDKIPTGRLIIATFQKGETLVACFSLEVCNYAICYLLKFDCFSKLQDTSFEAKFQEQKISLMKNTKLQWQIHLFGFSPQNLPNYVFIFTYKRCSISEMEGKNQSKPCTDLCVINTWTLYR